VYGAGLQMGWRIPRMITGIDVSVVLAFVNIGVLVWLGYVLATEAQRTLSEAPTKNKSRGNT